MTDVGRGSGLRAEAFDHRSGDRDGAQQDPQDSEEPPCLTGAETPDDRDDEETPGCEQ